MSKKNRFEKISPETVNEALKSAMATQRPGQTKEQTRLIAQGIQKGINHYKKQQKSKSREINKKLHKTAQPQTLLKKETTPTIQKQKSTKYPSLPWILLITSWCGFISYFFYTKAP